MGDIEKSKIEDIARAQQEWEEKNKASRIEKKYTSTGIGIKPLYTPADVPDLDYLRDIGFPGDYPMVRGGHPLGYRTKLWVTRQYAGFGTAAESNQRFKYLAKEGNTGLNIAFDLVTQMGLDSDNPEIEDEVGRVGVAIDSLEDMEVLFDGIPLDKVSTAFTINATAPIIIAMYYVTAEKQGVSPDKLGGTVQNDNLKEYFSRGAFIFPVQPTMRMTADLFEFCSKVIPKYIPVSVCGYHIRESGATSVQEIAFAFLNAIAYIENALSRGLDIDSFAPRLSFNFATLMGFFEEIAKYRAARRIWARILRDRFGAKDPKSWRMLYIGGSTGGSFTRRQPDCNVIRGAIETLASIISGAQASATHTKDEGHTIPTPEAQIIALRTQQLIAYETDVPNTIDPLAGSYFVESLTNEMEKQIEATMAEVEANGGIIKAIEEGWVQRLLMRQAYEDRRKVELGERPLIGENMFVMEEEKETVALHYADPKWVQEQIRRVRALKERRDNARVKETLDALGRAARGKGNIMYPLIDAVRAYATLGEMTAVLKEVFGEFKEPVNIF